MGDLLDVLLLLIDGDGTFEGRNRGFDSAAAEGNRGSTPYCNLKEDIPVLEFVCTENAKSAR
jgi:hypothetical protein